MRSCDMMLVTRSLTSLTLLVIAMATEQDFPFRNPNLTLEARVEDLILRLSTSEIVQQTQIYPHSPTPAIERLGINPYVWDSECLSGQIKTKNTAFAQSVGLAASFSTALLYDVATVISTEMRALWNNNTKQGEYKPYNGLSCFAPFINIVHHPLWGRIQEVYGEDPYLAGEMAATYVRGLQGPNKNVMRVSSGCKSFDVTSGPENLNASRFSFDANVTMHDLHMTYLVPFKTCVEAGTANIMCSYNSVNGIPSCANEMLMTDILRKDWGFKGHIVSDMDAINLLEDGHHYVKNKTAATAVALKTGCNMELVGDQHSCFNNSLEAIKQGLISEEEVRANIKPVFRTRMLVGEFDPPSMNPYKDINVSVIQSEAHREVATKAAAMSFVLLKNLNNVLPLQKSKVLNKIALVGPFASSNLDKLYGSYAPEIDAKYTRTPLQGLSPLAVQAASGAGCDDPRCAHYNATEVLQAIEWAEVIFVCLGTGTTVEVEGTDRTSLNLPGKQLDLLKDVVKHAQGNVPILLLVFSAGPLDLSWAQAAPEVAAILSCFFPSQTTGDALYRAITASGAGGIVAGRMPVSWPMSVDQIPPITNYGMEGHTYRYMHGDPLYPFGYGLSYSTFQYSDLAAPDMVMAGQDVVVTVTVTSSGALLDAEEVVQLYLSWGDPSLPAPQLQLAGFRRIQLKTGVPAKETFTITSQQMALWVNKVGFKVIPGPMILYVGGQQPNQNMKAESNVLEKKFTIVPALRPHFRDVGSGKQSVWDTL